MADINVDINLPSTISVDVTSPTQALAANVIIPGPQGPRGEKGNPTSINNLTAENIIISGADGNIILTSGTSTIFISGNSGYFQSQVNTLTTNLNNTGSSLTNKINNLSGLFTGYTGNLDSNYATDAQLASTGSVLDTKINTLSGYVNSQNTNISNNLVSTGSSLQSNINTLSSSLNSTGSILNSSISSLSGTLTSTYATITNLANTGSTLQTNINTLTSNLSSTGSTLVSSLNSTGSNLQNQINNLGNTYATVINLAATGSSLNNNINSLSGTLTANYYLKSNPSGFITGVDLSSYVTKSNGQFTNRPVVNGTGILLSGEAASLPTTIVYTTGDQTISGNKTFDIAPKLSGNSFITGVDLSSYYLRSNPSGFITGVDLSSYLTSSNASSTYATIINVASTGSNLQTQINNLGNTYATITNLQITGSTLDNKINSLSGNAVLKYGDQTISGLKDFTTRLTVNTIPVLLSGEASASIEQYVKNDEGTTIYKSQPVYVNGANGANILIKLARNTGELTSSKTFGLLKQDLGVNEFGYVISEGVISNVDTSQAGSEGDPIWLGPTGNLIFGLTNKPYAPNHLVYLGFVERKHQNQGKIFVKIQNGFELDELHNVQINHTRPLNNQDILRYNSASGLWFNESLNTGVFQTQINSLSGVAVLAYGDQTILGNKTFNDNTYINNLFVTGAQTIVRTNNFSVQSPYLLLNLTGGAVDGGIFFVTGSGLTGLNDTGPIIGFDHSKNFKFGVSTRNSDLSSLPDIASVQDLRTYSGVALNTFSTISNLASTGSTLDSKINTLSGWSASATNLASTGSTLNIKINNLSGYINSSSSNIVFTTGNQNINGNKIFFGDITLTGNINRIGKDHHFYTNEFGYAFIRDGNGFAILATDDSAIFDYNHNTSIQWEERALYDATNGVGLNWNERFLADENHIPILYWTGNKIGIGTNNPSEKLEVVGNVIANNLVYNTGNQTISGTKIFQDNTPNLVVNSDFGGSDGYAAIKLQGNGNDKLVIAQDAEGNSHGNNFIKSYQTLDIWTNTDDIAARFYDNVMETININNFSDISTNTLAVTSSISTPYISNNPNDAFSEIHLSSSSLFLNIYADGNQEGITLDNYNYNENSRLTTNVDQVNINSELNINGSLNANGPLNINGGVNNGFDKNVDQFINSITLVGADISEANGTWTRITGGTTSFSNGTYNANLYWGDPNEEGIDHWNLQVYSSYYDGTDLFYGNTGKNFEGVWYNINGATPPTTSFRTWAAKNYSGVFFVDRNELNLSGSGLNVNIALTGSNLNNRINSLSGWSASAINLASTGSALDTKINSLSGWSASATNLASTGSALDTKINSLSGWSASATNLVSTGSNLDTKINNLSGYVNSSASNIVFTTGNQLINGTKTFNSGVVINVQPTGTNPALYITGTWNDANVPYSGLVINITDTNSKTSNTVGDTTYLLELKTNNTSQIALTHKTNYSSSIPSMHSTSAGTLNIGKTNSTLYFGATQAGNAHAALSNNNFTFRNSMPLGWSAASAGSDIGTADLLLYKDLSGILAQRNGTNAQQFRVYNSTGTNSGEFGLFGWQNNQLIIGSQATNSGILRNLTLTGNNINIIPSGTTNIVGNFTVSGNTTITGHLSAASKSFLIDHPIISGKKLQYGSLEGPEHGVFVRGKTNDNIINLPDYWSGLVDENSISVNLTPISAANNIYVVDYNNIRVITNGNNGNDYFYTIYGERKDIPKLVVEF